MKKLIHFALFTLLAVSVTIPTLSFAQSSDGGVGSGDPTNNTFQLVPCTGVKNADGSGKECGWEDLFTLFRRLIKFVLFMLTPILVVMLIYTGFKYMTAGGDANVIAEAKRMLKPIIYGVICIAGAWLFVYTVLDKLLADDVSGIPKDQIIPESIRNSR